MKFDEGLSEIGGQVPEKVISPKIDPKNAEIKEKIENDEEMDLENFFLSFNYFFTSYIYFLNLPIYLN